MYRLKSRLSTLVQNDFWVAPENFKDSVRMSSTLEENSLKASGLDENHESFFFFSHGRSYLVISHNLISYFAFNCVGNICGGGHTRDCLPAVTVCQGQT